MIRKILTHRFLGIALLAVVVFIITFLFPASIQSQKPVVSVNVAYAQTPAPASKPPLVYQCVGTGVYAETPGCDRNKFNTGSKAYQLLRFALKEFDQAKALGNINRQSTLTNEIISHLTTLEYPIGADPIASARILITRDVPKQEAAVSNVTCTALSFFSATCWLRIISVVIGSLLVSISAWILALADMLFRWTVDNTILLFASEIFDKVKDGVNAGWTAMRDIANIVIIGMFTFLAISTILGIQEYGAKKLLARVLIIAVVINFSLLFTKIIIDASNFTAGQFYASAGGVPLSKAREDAAIRDKGGVPVKEADGFLSFRNTGFSGAFLNFMKITSVGDTTGELWTKAEQQGNWSALAHGILSALLISGAAAVLFYGSYLLIVRAILFIFLMITAAGAFATHLIPMIDDNTYGWKGWWSSLLHNAALAPLLMIFLWITLSVSSTMTSMNGGTLGRLASPTEPSSSDTGVLFSYFIILGLLFASFKLSSKWASKVGGLSLASMAVTAPFNIGSRLAGFALKNTVGRGAGLVGKAIGATQSRVRIALANIDPKKNPERYAKVKAMADKLEGRKRVAGWFEKQNYNPVARVAETSVGKLIAQQAGIKAPVSAGDAKTNFAEDAKKAAEAAVARAESAYVLTRSDQDKIREREERRQLEKWRRDKLHLEALEENAERTAAASEQQAATAKAMLQTQKQARTDQATAEKNLLQNPKADAERDLETTRRDAATQKATIELTSSAKIKGLLQRMDQVTEEDTRQKAAIELIADPAVKAQQDQVRIANTEAQKVAITQQIENKVAEKQGQIEQQDARIKDAENAVKGFDDRIRQIDKRAQKDIDALVKNADALKVVADKDKAARETAKRENKEFGEAAVAGRNFAIHEANEVVQEAINNLKKPGSEAAERYATDVLSRMIGRSTYKGAKAKTLYLDKQGKSRVRKNLEEYLADIEKSGATTHAPAAPAAASHTPTS